MKKEIDLSNDDIERGMLATRHMIDGPETSIKESKLLINSVAAALLLWGNTLTDEQRAQILNGEITEKDGDKLLSFITTLMVLLNAGMSATTVYQFMSLEETEDKKTDEFIRSILKSNAFFANGLLESFKTRIKELNKIFSDFTDPKLESFIQAELQKGKYNSRDLDDLTITEALELLQAAKAARGNEYGKATIINTDKIDFTLDKLTSNAWNLFRENTQGQLKFDLSVNMAAKKNRQEAPVTFSINFDGLAESNLKISKTLQPFDRRLYQAVSALYNAGNEVITLSSIYRHMGYRGRGGGNDIEKIRLSIIKMMTAQITLDNELELKTNRNYKRFAYRGALLPVEMGELYNIKGALTDAAIHVLREPPLITFARERKQITTIPLKLLQSPVNKNDANIAIDDYLIERIKREKDKGVKSCRILYTTLFKRTGIDTTGDRGRKQRQRTPDKVKKFLDYYMTEDAGKFIRKYTEQSDGITIYF